MASQPKFHSVAPVFCTTDLDRWLQHYEALGFTVRRHGDVYGFATWENVSIHVAVNPDHDPLTTAGCAYIYVDDAKNLHKTWSTVEGGRNVAPVDTDYGLCEGAHHDPDNNLIRYGSRLHNNPPTQQ
ncbi:Glyoxalase/Bleomycin resistance protein/Dihydroxybiphenyl dioxygenase [Cladorrhinum sp. PSN332]|nr:Glyoxalase/Bleomycin resistance protein/Dihydroxybiphenyl dioxygenase [Cladorrhinum sp. PSN332]